ncbi:hypothetical protein QE364_001831 [Nocardioides zeae]|uniref:Uncharacterized protein n=1 Tax=Nocardioides zeae TaxID=1457234 RepID=A0ACC6IHG3_9ACTN|nr:hypothetical protein [Nocardioides zeae]MDR6173131.1 hypothetical protein [Nocardioides zeae]MDR6210124.1 hypothetical protein [Nocardioides zeae]
MTALSIPAGTAVTSAGGIIGQITLRRDLNYVVTATVTALASQTGALQCQLVRAGQNTWDTLAEDTLTSRASITLQRAYPRSGLGGTEVLYIGCRTSGPEFVVESAQALAWQVTAIGGASGGGHVISGRPSSSLDWPALGE